MTYRRISYAVWEITLKCNLACQHCGSRAGHTRTNELSTAEALDLVKQMAEVGIKEVTIIGGEAFLRPDWLEIAQAITEAGMLCGMTTGGYGITLDTAHGFVCFKPVLRLKPVLPMVKWLELHIIRWLNKYFIGLCVMNHNIDNTLYLLLGD